MCRISALPALPWLPHLQELMLQDNEIAELGPCCSCSQLTALNLSFNAIADLDSIAAISPCTRLQSLSLHDNPVVELPGYATMRLQVQASCQLPSLCSCMSACARGIVCILKLAWRLHGKLFTCILSDHASTVTRKVSFLEDKQVSQQWRQSLSVVKCHCRGKRMKSRCTDV